MGLQVTREEAEKYFDRFVQILRRYDIVQDRYVVYRRLVEFIIESCLSFIISYMGYRDSRERVKEFIEGIFSEGLERAPVLLLSYTLFLHYVSEYGGGELPHDEALKVMHCAFKFSEALMMRMKHRFTNLYIILINLMDNIRELLNAYVKGEVEDLRPIVNEILNELRRVETNYIY